LLLPQRGRPGDEEQFVRAAPSYFYFSCFFWSLLVSFSRSHFRDYNKTSREQKKEHDVHILFDITSTAVVVFCLVLSRRVF